MLKEDEIKSFYNKHTSYLIEQGRIYGNPRHLKLYSFLKEIFKTKTVDNVLEIGCGIGVISEKIRKHALEVYSVDISENNVRFASLTVKNVNFICADFLQTQLNRNFDLVVLFDVLEHFPKPLHPKVFEKIREYSKEDTWIVITIPDPGFLDYAREHFPEKLQVVDESIYFDEFLALLRDFNLEIAAYQKYGIDYANQYRYYLLNYSKGKYILEKKDNNKRNKSRFRKIISSIMEKVRIEWRKFKYRKLLTHIRRLSNRSINLHSVNSSKWG